MINAPYLRYFLTDTESLVRYTNGQFVTLNDIQRRMFLKAREINRSLPDNYYRLGKEQTFEGIFTISDIFSIGLPEFAIKYLEIIDNRIYIRPQQQNAWQEVITYVPPLFMQCLCLHQAGLLPAVSNNKLEFYNNYIFPNTRYTALPGSRIPQLDYYVDQQNGLHDLHMHLNGALETDRVWQDYLKSPISILKDIQKAFKKNKVGEQLEQEGQLLDSGYYFNILKIAQKLRSYFYDYLFAPIQNNELTLTSDMLLQGMIDSNSSLPGDFAHPFAFVVNNNASHQYPMSIEGLMYSLVLEEISLRPNETFAGLFHFYLLILGLTNRLLVQQVHQNGFEQFQKHTLNGMRWASEKTYLRRYFQIHGNDGRNIRFLEGRFAPADNAATIMVMVQNIMSGWEEMKKQIREDWETNANSRYKSPQLEPVLTLTAHFIKEADDQKDPDYRHYNLRKSIWSRAKALGHFFKKDSAHKRQVVGADAAASEFDAQPEVFAAVFRHMRAEGIRHFTYHAGEDFQHILNGIRAIYEAIRFCGLKIGDRIGHATAVGLDVSLWHKQVGDSILIRQGEHLDNLVFVYHLIVSLKISSLHDLIPFITNKAQSIAFEVYNRHYPISILEQAWLLREYCPLHALAKDKNDIKLRPMFDQQEWDFVAKNRLVNSSRLSENNDVLDLFRDYHSDTFRKRYEIIIEVDTFDIIKPKNIEELQLALLAFMNRNEIVIETLPTSNIRIGYHENYSTYHLWNWIKWRSEGKSIPPIVVGSDDTGIFATNIYNEYANIYCALITEHNMPHNQIMEIIRKLDDESHIYRFQ